MLCNGPANEASACARCCLQRNIINQRLLTGGSREEWRYCIFRWVDATALPASECVMVGFLCAPLDNVEERNICVSFQSGVLALLTLRANHETSLGRLLRLAPKGSLKNPV